jgi:hypothetical protein
MSDDDEPHTFADGVGYLSRRRAGQSLTVVDWVHDPDPVVFVMGPMLYGQEVGHLYFYRPTSRRRYSRRERKAKRQARAREDAAQVRWLASMRRRF